MSISSLAQPVANSWDELAKGLKSGNETGLSAACRQLISKEGVDLRVMLSMLHANGVAMRGDVAIGLLHDYNAYKQSFFKTKDRFWQVDSLYTAAYLLHRNKKLAQEHQLKENEQQPLDDFNRKAPGVYHSRSKADYSYYSYLLEWLDDPQKTEDDVILAYIHKQGIQVNRLLSYDELEAMLPAQREVAFDTIFQKQLTRYTMLAAQSRDAKGPAQAIRYYDSLLKFNSTITGVHYAHARRLALQNRLKDEYIRLLQTYNHRFFDRDPYTDTGFSMCRNKEDKAFLKALLKENEQFITRDAAPPVMNWDLFLLLNRYAELHDFGAGFAYAKGDKDKKAALYVAYVMQSFTDLPAALKFSSRMQRSVAYDMIGSLNYITTHLLQYSLRGQRVDDAVFSRYFDALAHLVGRKLLNAEDYYWALDCYATGVKGRTSTYGWKLQNHRPYEDVVVDNPTTARNRDSLYLLPVKYMKQ